MVFLGLGGDVLRTTSVLIPSAFASTALLQPGTVTFSTFSHTVPPTLPPGDYILFAALVRQGALADDAISPSEVLAADTTIVRLP